MKIEQAMQIKILVAVLAVLVVIGASVAGYIGWQHAKEEEQRERFADYEARFLGTPASGAQTADERREAHRQESLQAQKALADTLRREAEEAKKKQQAWRREHGLPASDVH